MKLVRVDDHYEIESPVFSGSITLDAAEQFAVRLSELVAQARDDQDLGPETPCPSSPDNRHCEHWYDGAPCHHCGAT